MKHGYKTTYEVLYKYNDSGDEFVTHASGRPDIRNGYGMTEDDACSREWFERSGRNKIVILESEKIGMDDYQSLLSADESKYAEITRHHNRGIE